jgi:predicted transcriptional regulator
VKKTSLYLDEADLERLRRLAEQEGRSQADVVRSAIAAYELAQTGRREFSLEAAWAGDDTTVAGIAECELLAGFGE